MNLTGTKVLGKDLQLGDRVRLCQSLCRADEGYSDATVWRINTDGTVKLRRPYVTHNGVMYSGPSLITTIGIEDFDIWPTTEVTLLYREKELK